MKYSISLSDVSKVVFGGFLVDELTGNAIYWDEPQFDCEDEPNKTITCYRFTVELDAIKDLSWLKLSDWQSVADTMNMQDIVALGSSSDIFDRARVYESVGRYYGFNNFDGSPDEYNFAELFAMYPD